MHRLDGTLNARSLPRPPVADEFASFGAARDNPVMKHPSRITFERKHEPLLPHPEFRARMLSAISASGAVMLAALALGTLGYRTTEGLGWIDAALNAAMILTGMGPVDELHTQAGKLFAIVYALFSGFVFLTVAALFLAPIGHRLLHVFHLDVED